MARTPSSRSTPSTGEGTASDMCAAEGQGFGTKSIGFWGGVMLMINNLAGPTVALMPALAQESGWLAMILIMSLLASLSAACGVLLLYAVRKMPGNEHFTQRVEFNDLIEHYLPGLWGKGAMFFYHAYLILTLMSYVIQSGQTIDYVILDIFGCAPGLEFAKSPFVCGTQKESVTPFGSHLTLSSSMVIVALVCVPLSMMNLDDNIVTQWAAILGLSAMAVFWAVFMVRQPTFPQPLAAATSSQGRLIGILFFNFAFMSALPSWLNEKKPEVPVIRTFAVSMTYVVVVYTAIGVLGGLAFREISTDQNLFSKLNASGSLAAEITVAAYPILQNFTSIPVMAILVRYNLQRSGLKRPLAIFVAFGVPWLLSIPFYTGRGFSEVSNIGGYITSSVVNFLVPCALALAARRIARAAMGDKDLEAGASEPGASPGQ